MEKFTSFLLQVHVQMSCDSLHTSYSVNNQLIFDPISKFKEGNMEMQNQNTIGVGFRDEHFVV